MDTFNAWRPQTNVCSSALYSKREGGGEGGRDTQRDRQTGIQKQRETETDRARQRQRDRDRDRDRQTDRDKDKNRQTERAKHGHSSGPKIEPQLQKSFVAPMRTCRRQSKSYNSTIKLEVRGKSCNAVRKRKKFNVGLSPEIGVLAGTRSQEGYVCRNG